ncbi:glycosyltransferase [Amycolatopsis sp. cmx-11-51]|uniref:glycosyltransferase n=1 Tax=Amycolatopsis sp. cmx-11-51 TaxID=2785797 RepID=UPI0039E43C3E
MSQLDVGLLVAAPDDIAEELRPLPDNVHAGWLPLDVVVHSLDLLVHHTVGNTMLTALANGVPQVLIPYLPNVTDYAQRLSTFGAAVTVQPGEDTADAILAAAVRVLDDPSFWERATEIAEENAGQPPPPTWLGRSESRGPPHLSMCGSGADKAGRPTD